MGRRLQTQLPTHPANLYPNVQIKDRQLVEEKESSYQLNQQSNFDKGHKAKELSALEPGDWVWIRDHVRYGLVTEKNRETPILPCHYRKGHTPTKPLCFSSCSKTCWDWTTLSYANWWCQSYLASTCHPCIASAQHSAKASDSAGAPITTDSCASSYPRNNTGRVRTSTKSKTCSPDNSVRKNCEASRTLESLVEHWTACASVLHMNILICCYYSSCCSFVVFS